MDFLTATYHHDCASRLVQVEVLDPVGGLQPVANTLKTRHDIAMNAVRNMR